MISIIKKDVVNGKGEFIGELRGLSTELSGLTTFEGKDIGNGSIYICVDTGELYIFDGNSKQWNAI